MKFVSITSDEVKEAILEGNRISIQMHTYKEIRYAVENQSDVEEFFKYDSDCEKMFFGYINKGKKNKYVFLLMQYVYSSNTESCLDSLIHFITNLTIEIQQKGLKIKTLESEIENYKTEQDLDEVDKFIDDLSKDKNEDNINIVSNIKSTTTVNNQVKLPSQKSYITVDNFDIFI